MNKLQSVRRGTKGRFDVRPVELVNCEAIDGLTAGDPVIVKPGDQYISDLVERQKASLAANYEELMASMRKAHQAEQEELQAEIVLRNCQLDEVRRGAAAACWIWMGIGVGVGIALVALMGWLR